MQEIKYQKYYAPKGKSLAFAEGKTDEFRYTIVIEAKDGETSKLGIIKETLIPTYDIEGISVIGLAPSDVMDIIEGPFGIGVIGWEFGSEEERQKVRDIVGNDHVRMKIIR